MTPSSLRNLRCLRLSLSFQWQCDTDWDWLRALHQLTSIHLANLSKVYGGWHGVFTFYVSAIFVMYHHIAVWTLADRVPLCTGYGQPFNFEVLTHMSMLEEGTVW